MQARPRVLVSYFFGSKSIALGSSCARALEALGWEVFCFNSGIESLVDRYLFRPVNKFLWNLGLRQVDVSKGSAWNNQNYRQAQLERAVAEFRPDLLFIIRGHGPDGTFLCHLKRQYNITKTIGWWVKGPQWIDMMQAEAVFYDHYFCIHTEGYGENDRIIAFPALAVDDVLYGRVEAGQGKAVKREIVFVGGWTEDRQRTLAQIVDLPLAVYGQRWRKKNLLNPKMLVRIKKGGIWGEDLVRLYNSAKIALNISRWDTSRFTGLNLRVIDIPACGAFLLTDYSEGLREYFEPGLDIETFRDGFELRDKLKFYLAHDEQRERIARNGYEKVRKIGTYREKMKQLLDNVLANSQ